jgi:hypothetical protein
MGGREHIRIETVQDAFIACFPSICFLVNFERVSQQMLKVLLGTFRESAGTGQWAHSTARLFSEAVPLIRRDIFPSMYVRNM